MGLLKPILTKMLFLRLTMTAEERRLILGIFVHLYVEIILAPPVVALFILSVIGLVESSRSSAIAQCAGNHASVSVDFHIILSNNNSS